MIDVHESVLVIAAHPDDEVLGCGGAIAKLTQEGSEVHVAFLADGVGARYGELTGQGMQDELKRRREAAHAALALLGAKSVEFGDFPDNRMDRVDRIDIVQAVEKLVAEHRPTTIFTHHAGDLNVDHRCVHQAVVTACRPQPGHPVRTMLFFETPSSTEWQIPGAAQPFLPNWFIDISPFVRMKRSALEAYAAEMRPWPHTRSYEAVEHLARWRGATVGVEAAEAFVLGRTIFPDKAAVGRSQSTRAGSWKQETAGGAVGIGSRNWLHTESESHTAMTVAFRTDAALTIGHGHVMRCLTLANTLRKRGATVVFVCREQEGHLCDLIAKQGFAVGRLPAPTAACQPDVTPAHAAWLGVSIRDDVEQTRDALTALGITPDWLIVDHYAIDSRWESAMRPSVGHIMVIDDLADRVHDCDILLDQNFVAQMHTRYAGKVPTTCRMLLGPEYALLQPVYAELHGRVPSRAGMVKRVFVFFGGGDTDNLTGRTLNVLVGMNRPDIEVDVVVSSGTPHLASIRHLVTGHDNVHLHSDLDTLAPLMAKADLAIGASGATSWERLCLGLPALVITMGENQVAIAANLQDHGLIRWLGRQDTVDDSAIAQALSELIRSGVDEAWSTKCRTVLDGRGGDRVCTALTVRADTPLRVRHARMEDESLVWTWTRESAVGHTTCPGDSISAAIHRVLFHTWLRNVDGCHLYIIETCEGVPLGLVRFERSEQGWEIHHTLSPMSCGRDLARPFLKAALLQLRANACGALTFRSGNQPNTTAENGRWYISVCADANSWINTTIPELLLDWLTAGHQVTWGHDAAALPAGDMCFYLGYGRIVDANTLTRHKNNLVVHASELPRGRGWSPLTWQILEGRSHIPVTLFEATDAVDSGPIYKQVQLEFMGHELVDELRTALALATRELCTYFVSGYPEVATTGVPQGGEPTFYRRRRPKDSQFDVDRPLREQFNLLRTVDSKRYPAWCEIQGKRFALMIKRVDDSSRLDETLR